MVRAKFVVVAIDLVAGRITLNPVTSGSKENEEFYKYTPGGQIVLDTINEEAIKGFEIGMEYYVDFTKAE